MLPPQQQQQQGGDYGGGNNYAPSGYNGGASAYGASPVAGAQPSFFMTGGGFAGPTSSSYASPYAVQAGSQAPPAFLPPLQFNNGQPQPSQQQQQQQMEDGNMMSPNAAGGQPSHGRRAFMKEFLMSNGAGPESPVSAGRRERRKEALPDFHELEVIDASRRQTNRSVERMPVLVDHPVMGEYHQHTLSEYRRMQREFAKQRWGGLGPDDNEEKAAEREKRRKILEYGKQVNAVNFAVLDQLMGEDWHNRPIEKKLDQQAQLGLIKRQRAMMYADATKPPKRSNPDSGRQGYPKAKTPQPTATGLASGNNKPEDLESLEEKHRKDQEAIRRIKAQLNMIT